MDELNCIRTFIKVVDAGSFSEAARQVGLAKSVMTKRVNQLEEHLQLELMLRSTRRLSLTDTGANFYERCVPLLAQLDEAKAAVSSMEGGLTGRFRISCISSFTATYLAADLSEFQSQHPNLEIDLQQYDRFCDPVQEGIDICLQPTTAVGATLEKEDILPLRPLIVATSSYIKKYGNPQSADELVDHRFAHNSHVRPDNSISFVDGNQITPVAINPIMFTNTVSLLRSAVLSGEYMAMMPVFYIEKELITGELIPVLPSLRIENTVLSAFYRKSPYVPMGIKVFMNFLRDKYGGCPPWERRLLRACTKHSSSFGPDTQESE